MKALLDTNILIHREAPVVVKQDIGILFRWLDRLSIEKWVHPSSIEEINKHADPRVRDSFAAKLDSYNQLQAVAPLSPEVSAVCSPTDGTENDRRDTLLLNELHSGHVDLLITEDRGIHKKAELLSLFDKVFTVDSFLEKAIAENPEQVDYKVLAVRKTLCGNVDLSDQFFNDFRASYRGFDSWFKSKSQETCYICTEADKLCAYLYLKKEGEREPYSDIEPPFVPARRLKIGTFKVTLNGFKLGERFLKIVFDNAIQFRVAEIYVTIFTDTAGRESLAKLLEDFGFRLHGRKLNPYGDEKVFVRAMAPSFNAQGPRSTYPFMSRKSRAFLVSIYPKYHTDLFPDSILNTESPSDFVEHEPHRNGIRKVYISRAYQRDMRSGDLLVFYRTGGYYKGVVTTLGIVERVHTEIKDEAQFIRLCRQRSVFSDDELRKHWRYKPYSRPFIVDFLYTYSLPKRPNMEALISNGIIKDIYSAPRGFEQIDQNQLKRILELSEANTRLIVD